MLKKSIIAALAGILAACGGSDSQPGGETREGQAPSPVTAAPQANALKMYALGCGEIEISDLGVFSTSGEYDGLSDVFTDTCFLIRHPDGDLLWDLGLPSFLVGEPPQESDIFTFSIDRSITDQLLEIGLEPKDIEYVAISHQHFDHIGQVDQVQTAKWLVHEDEYNSMFPPSEELTDLDSEGQDGDGSDAGLANPYAGFQSLERELFTGEKDVFGDGLVIIFPTPGRTPGHTSLQVTLPQSGTVLLSGGLYHRTESRAGEHVPQINVSEPMTRESMKAFEDRAQRLGAKVIIQHERDDIEALPKFPKPLE